MHYLRRIKNSKQFKEALLIKPFIPFLRFCLRNYRRIKALLRKITFKNLYRLINNFSKDNRLLRKAGKAVRNREFDKAINLYSKVFENNPIDKESPHLDRKTSMSRLNISVLKRLNDIDGYKARIKQYKKENENIPKKDKIAVFTAITGGYDELALPEYLNPNFDYYVFTDSPINTGGIYKVRDLPYFSSDNTRMARFVKTHPHWLFTDYEKVIWVDANLMISGDLNEIVTDFSNSKKAIGVIQHPYRDSIYDEARECIKQLKDDPKSIKEQTRYYKSLGFDTDSLVESNFMIFDLRNKQTESFLNTWWSQINRYSKRDQLSINFAIDSNNIEPFWISKRPISSRNHEGIILSLHGSNRELLKELAYRVDQNASVPQSKTIFSEVRDKRIENAKKIKIDVVVCVHNALDDVKICLESVAKNRFDNQRLIIVDDASDTKTKNYLESFKKEKNWVRLIRNDVSKGYTKSANQGAKESTGELMILLNSDTVVTDGWAEKLADTVFSSPGAGIVGPMSSAASHQSIPNHQGTANQTAINDLPKQLGPNDINHFCEQWSDADTSPYVSLVHGFCIGVTREVLDNIGLFDEKNFPRGYGEENDLCLRAAGAGYGLVIATNTYVFHAKSKSFAGPERIKLMKLGGQKLRKLHGELYVSRAIDSSVNNPQLKALRDNAKILYMIADNYDVEFMKFKKNSKKISVILRDLHIRPQSSAFIRLISPLSQKNISNGVTVSFKPENTIYLPRKTDICIVQRTAYDDIATAKMLLKYIKKNNIKLISDIDDGFRIIDKSHPQYAMQKYRSKALDKIASESAVVWCSTSLIADQYSSINDNTKVIRNNLDFNIWGNVQLRKSNSNIKKFVYMGTGTHESDLSLLIKPFDQLNKRFPGSFTLYIIGIAQNIPARPYIRKVNPPDLKSTIYPNFVKWFLDQGPFDYGLSPLIDNEFNRMKSDIKCLDYMAAGIVPVVSNLEPYKNPSLSDFIIKVNSPDDWGETLTKIVKNNFDHIPPQNLTKYVKSSRDAIVTAQEISKSIF